MSEANATQVGGDHWTEQTIQCWDYIAANGLGYFEGNVVKYVSRWRKKNGVEDLEKAKHYLDKLIEMARSQNGIATYVQPKPDEARHVSHFATCANSKSHRRK